MRPTALPPSRLRVLHHGRLQKRWRYVGIFSPELMLCAGRVSVGGVPQAFWAVWTPADGRLQERTTSRPGVVALPDGRVAVHDGAVRIDLALEVDGTPVDVRSPHPSASGGPDRIWTRKTPVRARGTLTDDGTTRIVDARGLVDDSAGFHARRTAWYWAAGVGQTPEGVPLTWNLVDGLHDTASGSERQVWVGGVPREVGPVVFDDDLSAVTSADGARLTFVEQARRERDDRLPGGVVASDYVQPFGSFTGGVETIEIARGWGVTERHRARW